MSCNFSITSRYTYLRQHNGKMLKSLLKKIVPIRLKMRIVIDVEVVISFVLESVGNLEESSFNGTFSVSLKDKRRRGRGRGCNLSLQSSYHYSASSGTSASFKIPLIAYIWKLTNRNPIFKLSQINVFSNEWNHIFQ